jgi:hypothetical protein
MPFFFMLYSVIRGITNTVGKGSTLPYTVTSSGIDPNTTSICHSTACADPRYISETTKMYHDIVAAHGQLLSGGINFAAKLLSHHSSPVMYVPYAILVLGAVGLQYLQMARLNARNPQASQANPQAAMLQKYMPLIFGFIYLNVAAILNVYFIISSAIRIGTQEVLFRKGMVPGPNAPVPSSGKSRAIAATAKDAGVDTSERSLPKAKGGSAGKTSGTNGKAGTNGKPAGGTAKSGGAKTGSTKASNGSSPSGNGSGPSSNGSSNGSDAGSDDVDAAKKQHPRSKAKKERKAR